jgi:hypothetical protein
MVSGGAPDWPLVWALVEVALTRRLVALLMVAVA